MYLCQWWHPVPKRPNSRRPRRSKSCPNHRADSTTSASTAVVRRAPSPPSSRHTSLSTCRSSTDFAWWSVLRWAVASASRTSGSWSGTCSRTASMDSWLLSRACTMWWGSMLRSRRKRLASRVLFVGWTSQMPKVSSGLSKGSMV